MSCSGSLTSIHFCSVRSVTQKYLEKIDEVNFDKIFNQRLGKLPFYLSCLHSGTARLCILKRCFLLGFLLFKQYCEEISDEAVPQLSFYEEVCVPQVTSHFRIFTFKIDQGLSTIRWGKRVTPFDTHSYQLLSMQKQSYDFATGSNKNLCWCLLIIKQGRVARDIEKDIK